MVDEALALPDPIVIDRSYLRLFPSAQGHQHDEVRAGFSGIPGPLRRFLRWKVEDRKIRPDAPLHPSVLERFAYSAVRIYDVEAPYRPGSLKEHEKVAHLYAETAIGPRVHAERSSFSGYGIETT